MPDSVIRLALLDSQWGEFDTSFTLRQYLNQSHFSQQIPSPKPNDDDGNHAKRMRLQSDVSSDYGKVMKIESPNVCSSDLFPGNTIINLE